MSFPLTGYPRFPPPHLCTSVNLVYSHQSRVNNISGITTIKKRTNFYTRFFAKVATGLVHYDRTERKEELACWSPTQRKTTGSSLDVLY